MKLKLLWNRLYWRYRHNWGDWQIYHDNPQDGVKGTYKFDLDALSSSYVPPEEVTNLISKCMDAV
jgi:hypothetical protein